MLLYIGAFPCAFSAGSPYFGLAMRSSYMDFSPYRIGLRLPAVWLRHSGRLALAHAKLAIASIAALHDSNFLRFSLRTRTTIHPRPSWVGAYVQGHRCVICCPFFVTLAYSCEKIVFHSPPCFKIKSVIIP